ncbi:MAG: hypothetical protein ACRBDL_07630 [Alphaproteobacteria bacterium]
MKNTKRSKRSPLTLRLSDDEWALLDLYAGGTPLSAYVRTALFGEKATKRRKSKRPAKDYQPLIQAMGTFARSQAPNNLNQIAKAIHTGTLSLTPEIEISLVEACADISEIRRLLITTLRTEA